MEAWEGEGGAILREPRVSPPGDEPERPDVEVTKDEPDEVTKDESAESEGGSG